MPETTRGRALRCFAMQTTEVLAQVKRARRPALGFLAAALGLGLLAVLEWKSASFAYDTQEGEAALQYAVLSIVCGLTGFIGFAVASLLSEDERPRVRARAFGARIVALVMMCVPVANLATAFAYDKAMQDWRAYTASEVYKLDQQTAAASAMDVGTDTKRDAAFRLIPPTPNTVFDPLSWLTAIALHWAVLLSGGALRVPAAITDRERDAMIRAAKNAKRRKARKAKPQAASKTEKPKLFSIGGGKS